MSAKSDRLELLKEIHQKVLLAKSNGDRVSHRLDAFNDDNGESSLSFTNISIHKRLELDY